MIRNGKSNLLRKSFIISFGLIIGWNSCSASGSSEGEFAPAKKAHLPPSSSLPSQPMRAVWENPPTESDTQFASAKGLLAVCAPTSVSVKNAATGQQLWSHSIDDQLQSLANTDKSSPASYAITSPTIASNLLICGFTRLKVGYVKAFDLQTGQLRWIFAQSGNGASNDAVTRTDILCRPTIWKDKVVFRSGEKLVALDLSDGKLLWSCDFAIGNRAVYLPSADPLVTGDRIYFNSDSGIAYGFDLNQGRQLWRAQTDGYVVEGALNVRKIRINIERCSPVLLKNHLLIADGFGNIYALDPKNGAVQWRNKISYTYKFETSGGNLYASTFTGLYQIDPASGQVIRRQPSAEGIFDVIVRGKVAFTFYSSNRWQIIDLTTWKPLRSGTDIDARTVPIIVGDVMFANCVDSVDRRKHQLTAFRLGPTIR